MNCTPDFNKLRRYVADRVRNFLRRRRGRKPWVYEGGTEAILHGRYGVFPISLTAPWKAVVAHVLR
ncbi:MAG: hypothetical protein AAB308_04010 [Nitrospirota bacterium]